MRQASRRVLYVLFTCSSSDCRNDVQESCMVSENSYDVPMGIADRLTISQNLLRKGSIKFYVDCAQLAQDVSLGCKPNVKLAV
jgi:hypothetical protein